MGERSKCFVPTLKKLFLCKHWLAIASRILLVRGHNPFFVERARACVERNSCLCVCYFLVCVFAVFLLFLFVCLFTSL